MAITSAVLGIVAPLAAWITVELLFPDPSTQATADSGNTAWAVAMLGVGALFRASGLFLTLSTLGLMLGLASALRRERRRKLRIWATSAHAVMIAVMLVATTLAIHNLAQ
jgi:hypothetical protein